METTSLERWNRRWTRWNPKVNSRVLESGRRGRERSHEETRDSGWGVIGILVWVWLTELDPMMKFRRHGTCLPFGDAIRRPVDGSYFYWFILLLLTVREVFSDVCNGRFVTRFSYHRKPDLQSLWTGIVTLAITWTPVVLNVQGCFIPRPIYFGYNSFTIY